MNKRMFFALDISSADKAKVALWCSQNLTLPFKVIEPNNFHVTLAFLGLLENNQQASLEALVSRQHDDIQQNLKLLLATEQDFSLHLSKVGYFKKAQVLHLMPDNCPNWLVYLNTAIVELSLSSNIALEQKPYQPHLSIYRKVKSTLIDIDHMRESIVIKQPIYIKSFSLYHSYATESGVKYLPIKTWQL